MIDRFFDTPQKRQCAFLLLVASMMILAATQTWILGLSLGKISAYQDLFEMLKTDVLSMSYISRCIYAIISQASITPINIVTCILQSLHFFEIAFCIVLGLFIIARHSMIRPQRWLWIALGSFIMALIACVVCVINGYQARSLLGVIQQLQMIGCLLAGQSLIQVVCCFVCIYQCVHSYYAPAMQVQVEYIEEEKK